MPAPLKITVMRFLVLFALLFICSSADAQTEVPPGRYDASFGLFGASIQFQGKDSFYYHFSWCQGFATGKGNYYIRGKLLYLFFEKAAPEEQDYYSIVIRKPYLPERKINSGQMEVYEIESINQDAITIRLHHAGNPFATYKRECSL
jgi:hypothetical protein